MQQIKAPRKAGLEVAQIMALSDPGKCQAQPLQDFSCL